MTVAEARDAFPVLERYAYLNAGTMGPLARSTVEAMARQQQAELERGRGVGVFLAELLEVRERVRARLAGLLMVEPETVSLTSSTTDGCNIVLAGLGLGADDEIVTTDVEHFGMLGPLHASGARVRVARIRDRRAEEALDGILGEVTKRTRLLAVSHVAWTTGNLLPVRELKDASDLPVLVDGAQSAGAIPVDARGFDFYTVSAQKWLCGPDGTGALVVADPDRLRVAAPSYFSQQEYELDGSYTPKPGAERFDPGWLAPAALAGLVAALDTAPDWRYERAAAMAARCRERLAEHFQLVTAPDQATLVTFQVPGDAAELSSRAFEQGVVIRSLPQAPWLRASCGYWTSDEDIDRLVEAARTP